MTPVLVAAMNAATMTASLVPGTSPWNARPRHAPMKNNGMMKPPRHSDESVTEVPASFAQRGEHEERDGAAVLVEDLVDLRLTERERVRRHEPERGEEQPADEGTQLRSAVGRAPRGVRCSEYVNATATSAPPIAGGQRPAEVAHERIATGDGQVPDRA